jgi:rSAM/selenodomain-associated transferase 2
MQLSIIIPVLNDAPALTRLLPQLAPLRQRGAEVIVVDGGSTDESMRIARESANQAIAANRGRALQQNAGAAAASGDALWFLHADCAPPEHADRLIEQAVAAGASWGRFDVRLQGNSWLLPMVAWSMNHRSHLTGICTGDQGLFVTRAVYDAAGGFPSIALMEDIAFSKALKRCGPPARIVQPIIASGRRWDKSGAWRTIFLMWWLRLRYFFGADPTKLHHAYYAASTPSKER